ncbi:MAG: hypothetical protein R2939_07485 [Kofleriaceae bacterium]
MRVVLGLATLGALVVGPASAHAGDNDLVLARLSRPVDVAGQTRSVGQSLEFRALMSELGVVMAPRLLTPADTLGFGGFQLSTDVAFTTINADERYWRARLGADDPAGGSANGDGMMSTVGVFARKGWWFPLPSFEAGAGVVHLRESGLWAAQGYAKLALHEGYHGLPIPSVAVRGAASRLFGESDLGLSIASLDVTASKHLGVGGTWSIDPFAGWNLLWVMPTSEVLDPTPGVDPLDPMNADDRDRNFVFRDQDPITRHRLFVGAKLQYDVIEITLEGQLALAGGSVDDRAGTSDACTFDADSDRCDADDLAGSQQTLTISVGVDF